jgi:hypothetical protein
MTLGTPPPAAADRQPGVAAMIAHRLRGVITRGSGPLIRRTLQPTGCHTTGMPNRVPDTRLVSTKEKP